MEQNNHKFRLRLNLFDAIILVAVLLVGAAAAWIGLRSGGETTPTAAPVRYTVMFQKMREGESALHPARRPAGGRGEKLSNGQRGRSGGPARGGPGPGSGAARSM